MRNPWLRPWTICWSIVDLGCIWYSNEWFQNSDESVFNCYQKKWCTASLHVSLFQLPATIAGACGSSANYPPGTVLLKTRLHNGEISYQDGDILERKDRWQPSKKQKNDMRGDHESTPEVIVQFFINADGEVAYIYDYSRPDPVEGERNCLVTCFLGLAHYLRILWGWICGWFRPWKPWSGFIMTAYSWN